MELSLEVKKLNLKKVLGVEVLQGADLLIMELVWIILISYEPSLMDLTHSI